MKAFKLAMALAFAGALMTGASYGGELSIYDVQHDTTDGDASIYDGGIHNVSGGVVTHKWSGFQDRVYIQNPAFPEWGAIAVKDSTGGELYDAVAIGDWVSFDNILVEEYRGTTFLQYNREESAELAFTVESSGNPVPAPTLLSAADLSVPVNHAASEPYESMIATLENVTVGAMDLGKAEDNYELWQGDDKAWGADYMNIDAGGLYHPYIHTGAQFASITGVVEQYTKLSSGWDYYQLITRSTGDIVPEPSGLALFAFACVCMRRRR